jgi:ribulose-phosphate 3-epimerase
MQQEISLWSADLANLEAEIECAQAHASAFHLDVSDGYFSPELLFFPALVRRIRGLTRTPLHLHIFANEPQRLLPSFFDCGIDLLSVQWEAGEEFCVQALEAGQKAGMKTGLAIGLGSEPEQLLPYAQSLQHVVLMGTRIGIKGVGLDPRAPGRIRYTRELLGPGVQLIADGGIRQESLPLLEDAGADHVVAGSLFFGSR